MYDILKAFIEEHPTYLKDLEEGRPTLLKDGDAIICGSLNIFPDSEVSESEVRSVLLELMGFTLKNPAQEIKDGVYFIRNGKLFFSEGREEGIAEDFSYEGIFYIDPYEEDITDYADAYRQIKQERSRYEDT